MPNFEQVENKPTPDYMGLLRFLMEPFLEPSESLSIDCETINQNQKVWIRVAIDTANKGHIYGRGGRNLMAIRTVLAATGAIAGQSIYLDVYGSESDQQNHSGNRIKKAPESKPMPKPKLSQDPVEE